MAEGGNNPSNASARVLLPQPDSPRMLTVSPAETSNVAPSSARTGSPSEGTYATLSPRTCNSGFPRFGLTPFPWFRAKLYIKIRRNGFAFEALMGAAGGQE